MERSARVAGLSPLSRVKGLAPGLVKELERANIRSPADVLMLSDIALMHLLNISLYLARQVIQDVCNHVAPVPTTVAELAKASSGLQPALPSPFPSLDTTLLGGLPPSVIEVTGAAGAGKTQFCMSCAARAGIIGSQSTHKSTVVYVDTEGALDPKRLRQILRELCGKDETRVSSALGSIFIVSCDTVEALQKFITELEELILAKNVSLLIVDSVASIIRRFYTSGTRDEGIARSDTLARLAGSLKIIADTFRIPVIVTNQVRCFPI
jgi:RAD51-like protein 1